MEIFRVVFLPNRIFPIGRLTTDHGPLYSLSRDMFYYIVYGRPWSVVRRPIKKAPGKEPCEINKPD
jgi:hypothetical protein